MLAVNVKLLQEAVRQTECHCCDHCLFC